MSNADPASSPDASTAPPEPPKSERQLAAEKLDKWNPDAADLVRIIPIVQRSLDTTTKLTEYEDGKAARVLTAMAFVSGLAIAVHNLTVNQIGGNPPPAAIWVHPLYLFYYGTVVVGSLLLICAIFPRFNIPKTKKPQPFSLIFGPEIVRIKLDDWVNEFATRGGVELQLRSIRNEIMEARLVAEKCAKKIRWLRVGMGFYLAGLATLIAALSTSFNLLVVHAKTAARPGETLLIFDADNTLWATNEVYANAQGTLATRLARAAGISVPGDPVVFVRSIEEDLAVSGRGFNLPASLVADAVAQKLAALKKPTPASINPAEITSAAQEFERTLKLPPALFPGVEDTLRRLKNQGYRMVLLSESASDLLEERLKHHALEKYFEHVTARPKSVLVFKEIANDYVEIVRGNVISIGDRLDVDIQFAMQSGFKGVWIPGGYRPKAANVAVVPTLSLTAFRDLPEKLPTLLTK